MKRALILTGLLGLLLGGHSFGQDTAKATFHVTSVRSEEAKDWCTTGKCSATRRTVEGRFATMLAAAGGKEKLIQFWEAIGFKSSVSEAIVQPLTDLARTLLRK